MFDHCSILRFSGGCWSVLQMRHPYFCMMPVFTLGPDMRSPLMSVLTIIPLAHQDVLTIILFARQDVLTIILFSPTRNGGNVKAWLPFKPFLNESRLGQLECFFPESSHYCLSKHVILFFKTDSRSCRQVVKHLVTWPDHESGFFIYLLPFRISQSSMLIVKTSLFSLTGIDTFYSPLPLY